MAFQRYMKPDYCMYPCLLGNNIAKSVNIPNLSAFLSNDNSNFISSRSTFTQTMMVLLLVIGTSYTMSNHPTNGISSSIFWKII